MATDFLAGLDAGAESRVLRDLRKLAVQRHELRGITKPLGHGLFELITSHNKMEYRCIYVYHGDDIIVLVCFIKKQQKTPKPHLDLAQDRYAALVKEEITLGEITLH